MDMSTGHVTVAQNSQNRATALASCLYNSCRMKHSEFLVCAFAGFPLHLPSKIFQQGADIAAHSEFETEVVLRHSAIIQAVASPAELLSVLPLVRRWYSAILCCAIMLQLATR